MTREIIHAEKGLIIYFKHLKGNDIEINFKGFFTKCLKVCCCFEINLDVFNTCRLQSLSLTFKISISAKILINFSLIRISKKYYLQ